MPRIPAGRASRGSQRWLQLLANDHPHLFEAALARTQGTPQVANVRWLSPLTDDDWAEYQDSDFLKRLGISLKTHALEQFWPRRGPVWDGLASSDSGEIFLVEAKANLPELASPASQASPASAKQIEASLRTTMEAFGAPPTASWSGAYYQYANRLAHLYLLRELNGLPAWLVFLYFVNADDVSGPSSVQEWREAIGEAHKRLELGKGPLSQYVLSVFVDVNDLSP